MMMLEGERSQCEIKYGDRTKNEITLVANSANEMKGMHERL